MDGTLLSVTGLSKHFGPSPVLSDVSVDLRSGEILGLVGQNGSGKSTFIKCLAGFHAPDPGWRLEINGTVLTRAVRPGEATSLGISFVHQDLGMIGDLTVLENLQLSRLGKDRRWYIPWSAERAAAHQLLESFGLSISPRARLGELRPIEAAQVAIIRAVMELRSRSGPGAAGVPGTGVLVLDEATTFLDRTGRESLYALLRSIAASGSGVLFVSHDVGEVLSLTDRVTVLRDGRVSGTVTSAQTSAADMVELIVGGRGNGRPAPEARTPAGTRNPAGTGGYPEDNPSAARGPADSGPAHIAIRDLTGEHVAGISFTAGEGEIVGVTGIVGAGWEAVPDYLYGAEKAASGHLDFGGQTVALPSMSPRRALNLGMVLVPSQRLVRGIVGGLSLQDNVMMPVLGRFFTGGRLRLRRLASHCQAVLDGHAVHPPVPSQAIGTLSGGNQQKAVLGKWLQTGPRLVLLNEPTQGVDVGARQLIFQVIKTAASDGAVVLYASADWEEVARLADKVVVIADGRVAATLRGPDVTVEGIAAAAYQGTRRSADMAAAAREWAGTGAGPGSGNG